MDDFLKGTNLVPPTRRQKQHQALKSSNVETNITISHRRNKKLVTIPNPKLLEVNSVELRRYHERAIVNNRYKSIEWSAIALLLVADIVGSNTHYSTSKALGLEYTRLALKFTALADRITSGPDVESPTQLDIRKLKAETEKQARKALEAHFEDTGILPKNGQRPILDAKEIDSLIEAETFILETELEDGTLNLLPNKVNAELSKRIEERSGYSAGYVRKLQAKYAERNFEREENNRRIDRLNLESDDT